MAASRQSPTVNYTDFISELSGGQNSGVHPLKLQKDQYAFGLNLSLRGGYAHTRPPVVKLNLNFHGNTVIQDIVENGFFQGGGYYRPDYGTESLIAQISGRLLLFTEGNSGWDVTDISVPGDFNNATIPQVWMWQSERWMIVQDGSGALPIFYDGVFSRRSYGPSVELGEVSLDFIPPIIGDTVDLTLSAPYTGPFNIPVILNGAFYEPVSYQIVSTNFNARLTNLSATAGVVVPKNTGPSPTQILAIPSRAGVIEIASSISISSAFFPVGTEIVTFTLASPYLGAIGSKVSITGTNSFTNGATIVWQVTAVSGNTITVKNSSQIGSSSPLLPGEVRNNGYDYPVGTFVNYNGSSAPNVVVATLGDDFTVPAIGSTVPILTNANYTGADNQIVWINGIGEFSIIYTPPAPPSAIITVLNLTDTTNNPMPQYPATVTAPQEILSVPELPAGRMGAYGMERNWMSLVDGISYIAGDIVGGASGTQVYNFRDSVLKTTENDFLAGGGAFRLAGAGDQITAMVFPPNINTALGQGPLEIFTAVSATSNNSPVDRTLWEQLTSPLQTISLKGNGALSQNGTILVNSDIFYRSFIGYSSFVLASRDFKEWGNRGISNEMQRPLLKDNQSLLQFGSGMDFDNRFIATAAPNLIGAGVFHVGECVMNFDLISSVRASLSPAWEGAWSGINTMQLITGRVNGTNRAFSFTYNLNNNKIELWEQLAEAPAIQAGVFKDNDDTAILSVIETATLFNNDIKPLTDLCELIDGEMYLSDVTDTVNVKVFYRPDFYPCWVLWNEFNLCEDDDNSDGDGNKKPGYWMRIGLGQPTPDTADDENSVVSPDVKSPANDRPLRVGFFHQFRIEITGYATFRAMRVQANSSPQSVPAPTSELNEPCQLIDCTVPDDLQIYSLQGFIPLPPPANAPLPSRFRNQVVYFPNVCPSGIPSFSGTLPSWISLDADGNRFVGKAGVFGAATQAAANALAQSALNTFVGLNIGDVSCASADCIMWVQLTFGAALTDVSSATNTMASFTPDSSTGAVLTAEIIYGDGVLNGGGEAIVGNTPTPPPDFTGDPNSGTLTFDSQATYSCNLHLSITKDGDFSTTRGWIEIYNLVNPGFDLQLKFDDLATGEYDFPFTVQNQSTNAMSEFVDMWTAANTASAGQWTYRVVATVTCLGVIPDYPEITQQNYLPTAVVDSSSTDALVVVNCQPDSINAGPLGPIYQVNYSVPGFGTAKTCTLVSYNTPGYTSNMIHQEADFFLIQVAGAPNSVDSTGWTWTISTV